MRVDPEDLISQTTAAKIRGVTKQSILHLIQRGKFRTIKIDGHAYLFRSEVEKFKPSKGGRPKGTRTKRSAATPFPVDRRQRSPSSNEYTYPVNILPRNIKFKPEDLVTQTTAARMRAVTKQSILNLVRRGRLNPVVIDGHTFLLRSEVEKFEKEKAGRPKGTKAKTD